MEDVMDCMSDGSCEDSGKTIELILPPYFRTSGPFSYEAEKNPLFMPLCYTIPRI